MNKDTIERAIQRGAGGLEGENLEEVSFEGYGPGGIAIMVESMTDNNNRTVAEVRHAFTKSGGNLGTNGSVSYLFEKKVLSMLLLVRILMKSWKYQLKLEQKTLRLMKMTL